MYEITFQACSSNNPLFTPINWEQFKKMNHGQFNISEESFELITHDGEILKGTLECIDKKDNRDILATRYLAHFESGLNCYLEYGRQKKSRSEFYDYAGLKLECLFHHNNWFIIAHLSNPS